MRETIAFPLEAWASFCVIVGSSAGALTGLQFVLMTSPRSLRRTRIVSPCGLHPEMAGSGHERRRESRWAGDVAAVGWSPCRDLPRRVVPRSESR